MKRLAGITAALALVACEDPPPPKLHFTPMTAPDAGPPPEPDAGAPDAPDAPDAGYVFRAPHRERRPLDEALYQAYLPYAYHALELRQPMSGEIYRFSMKMPPGDPAVVKLIKSSNERWRVMQDQLLVEHDLTAEEVDLMEHFTGEVNHAAVVDQELSIDVAGRAEFNAMPKAIRDSLRQQELSTNKALRDQELWKKIESTYGTAAMTLGKKHRLELRRLFNDTVLSSAGIMKPHDAKRPKPPR